MDTNFNGKVGKSNNFNFNGLKDTAQKPKDKSKNIEAENVEESAQKSLGFMGRAFVNMSNKNSFKGSIAEEKTGIREMTDAEFEERKKELYKTIDALPEDIQDFFRTPDFDKYKLFIAEKILSIPQLVQNKNIQKNFAGVLACVDLEDAQAKCNIIDKIMQDETLKNNKNMLNFIEKIICTTDSSNKFQFRCSIIDKIMNNESIKNNKKVMDVIGAIVFLVQSEENLKAKSMIIDKFMEYEELKDNKSMISALGGLIAGTNSKLAANARCNMIDEIVGTKNLRTNKGIMDNLGAIVNSVDSPKKVQAKLEVIGEIELIIKMLQEEETSDKTEGLKEGMAEIILHYNGSHTQMQEIREMIYDDGFPNSLIGAALTHEKNFYKDNRKQVMEIYQNNKDKIQELQNNGYTAAIANLQNSDEIDIVFNKTEENININDNLLRTKNTVRLNKNGVVSDSQCKVYENQNGEILEHTTTSDGKYTCDSYYKTDENKRKILTKEIRVVNGKNGPIYVQKTTTSPIMKGVFDTTIYNLAQTDKNTDEVLSAIKNENINKSSDILEKIEKAGIKGWDFARTIENPDGTKTHIEKFQRGDYHTQRKYTSDDRGEKTSLDYTISDTHGKKLLNIHRTFELQGNKSTATLNGKEYIAEFNDEEMKVKIGDVEIDFKEKMESETFHNKKILWEAIKKTPGDLILNFRNIQHFGYEEDNGRWNCKENTIKTDSDLSTISHELGHYLDSTEGEAYLVAEIQQLVEAYGKEEDDRISHNPELIKIYNEEMEDFKKSISEAEQKNIEYFSQTGGNGGTGLSELVAEVNMLCTTQINTGLQTRSMYLTRYFPKTTAKAAELLSQSTV